MANKEPGRCVFCDGRGMSKEHIWSEWIHKIVPRIPCHFDLSIIAKMDPVEKTATITPGISPRQGSLNSRRVRKVCERCNSGWMSGIVSRAKPPLEQMVLGNVVVLNRANQRDISAWIALTSIMAQYTDDSTRTISETERKHVWINEEPSPLWVISIGKCDFESSDPVLYRHRSGRFLRKVGININSTKEQNFCVSTHCVGQLILQAFCTSSSILYMQFLRGFVPRNMRTIWPSSTDDLGWPLAPVIAVAEIQAIANRFFAAFAGDVR